MYKNNLCDGQDLSHTLVAHEHSETAISSSINGKKIGLDYLLAKHLED